MTSFSNNIYLTTLFQGKNLEVTVMNVKNHLHAVSFILKKPIIWTLESSLNKIKQYSFLKVFFSSSDDLSLQHVLHKCCLRSNENLVWKFRHSFFKIKKKIKKKETFWTLWQNFMTIFYPIVPCWMESPFTDLFFSALSLQKKTQIFCIESFVWQSFYHF